MMNTCTLSFSNQHGRGHLCPYFTETEGDCTHKVRTENPRSHSREHDSSRCVSVYESVCVHEYVCVCVGQARVSERVLVCVVVCVCTCMWWVYMETSGYMGCLPLFFPFYILFCFRMCMRVWSRVCQSECVTIRGQSGLLACGFLELHSGYQAWWQGPLPIELSHFSSTLLTWDRVSYLTGNLLVQLDWLARESPGYSCEGNPDVYHRSLLFMPCWGPDLGHSRSHLLVPSVCV